MNKKYINKNGSYYKLFDEYYDQILDIYNNGRLLSKDGTRYLTFVEHVNRVLNNADIESELKEEIRDEMISYGVIKR